LVDVVAIEATTRGCPVEGVVIFECERLLILTPLAGESLGAPADQLADGLVVSAVAAVQTVVVDWTTGGGVVRCHSMSYCDWSGLLTAPRQVCRLAPVMSPITSTNGAHHQT